ncbi:MAG: hypothetical protein IPL32_18275 [Chloracidobacterium sp.]|nr:hypothetical protein [Chloracidobacterium sp.]
MDLFAQVQNWVKQNFWRKRDHVDASTGTNDAGLPVVLNAAGRLGLTLLSPLLGILRAYGVNLTDAAFASQGNYTAYVGEIAKDYTPTAANWNTTETTLLINGLTYTVIGFHDSGARVDFIRVGAGVIVLGYDGGFGGANVEIVGTLRLGKPGTGGATSEYILVQGGASTVNSGNGRNLYIIAGSSDNAAGKRGGNTYIEGGVPTSPATTYGDVHLALAGGQVGIAYDTDRLVVAGRSALSATGHGDCASVSHVDHNNTSEYGFLQDGNGDTYINAKTGAGVRLRINNGDMYTILGSVHTWSGNFGAWNNLSFGSGWANYGGGWQGGQYRKIGDMVYLRGLVARTSGVGTIIATLPAGHYPPVQMLNQVNGTDAHARVDITTSGVMTLAAGTPTYISLNDIPPFSVI